MSGASVSEAPSLFLKLEFFRFFVLGRDFLFLFHKVIDGLALFFGFFLFDRFFLFSSVPADIGKFCNVYGYNADQKNTESIKCALTLYREKFHVFIVAFYFCHKIVD